jgi:AraC-like DNA-binding protein
MAIVTFSSDDFPAELDDQARFSRWVELFSDRYRAYDQYRFTGEKFSARFEQLTFNGADIAWIGGALARGVRTRRHVAADPRPNVDVVFIRGADMIFQKDGGEATGSRRTAIMLAKHEPLEIRATASHVRLTSVRVPREKVFELVRFSEDLDLRALDCGGPVTGLLSRYVDLLLQGTIGADEPLAAHVESTLVDLIALALGAPRDVQEVAQGRGLRAARLQDVCAAIQAGFADPAFSPQAVASRIGVSPNYIHKLLHQSGATFMERVLELRLQKARAMLADRRNDRTRVSDIALACGFNEISHFNRCFRRRFGASPLQFRG